MEFTTSELTWSAVEEAASYDVYFGTINLGFIGNFPDTACPVSGLEYNPPNQWQVIPKNEIGEATGCNIWTFTTEIISNVIAVSEKNYVKIYPNSTSDVINIKAVNNIENIVLQNHLGQQMLELNPKSSFVKINTSSFKAGFYFISVQTKKGLLTRKITIR